MQGAAARRTIALLPLSVPRARTANGFPHGCVNRAKRARNDPVAVVRARATRRPREVNALTATGSRGANPLPATTSGRVWTTLIVGFSIAADDPAATIVAASTETKGAAYLIPRVGGVRTLRAESSPRVSALPKRSTVAVVLSR